MRYIRLIRNLSNWWLHFAVKLGLTEKDPLIFRTWRGIVIEVPRRLLHEFKEIFMEETYTRELALKVPENPTIIDIGANAGFFSLFAAFRYPGSKILAFEPIPANFKQLKRNKELNKNVQMECLQKAVFSHSGTVSLSYDPNDSFTTSASVIQGSDPRNNTIKVPCLTLPEIFDEYRLDQCDLLKMDCEGAEYEILYNCPGSYLRRISQMALEVHGGNESNQNMSSLIDFLKSNDYKTRRYSYVISLA